MIHIPLTLTGMQSNLPLIPQIMLRNKSKKVDRNFHPGDYDIICGRGKSAHHHPGNKRFRLVICMFMDEYKNAPTKVDKSLVIIKIVDIIWRWGGAFVKMDKAQNKWNTIDDRLTREKVGHAIRDAMTAQEDAFKRGKIDKYDRIVSGMTIDQLMELSPSSLKKIENGSTKAERIIGNVPLIKSTQGISIPLCSDADSGDCSISSDSKRKATRCMSTVSCLSHAPASNDQYGSFDISPIKIEDIAYQNFDDSLMSSFLEEGGILEDSLIFSDNICCQKMT
mmetsp:Transcript_8046/g.12309  ORF Transcript_8046/g.12309 Transcript_8046/m.12309 type:complete len:280 (-) Transcript_8046:119-958(-)|eukprot:CAMPEP_0178905148 /NCGR_PEP_ID=MMETSP0786-20121207/6100_1 /TAXON_ID=186022 /ORGANISM="Thalassionema frauenfeldii, Strain CCMP 1798" /LENGTH=279 /DNA_ID=CAMNT_0020576695 /DNA_START=29 /DNA_END=868 /DNA_ORIENTATION=-